MQMHNRLGSWVTLPCHIHLGGVLKMIIIKIKIENLEKENEELKKRISHLEKE